MALSRYIKFSWQRFSIFLCIFLLFGCSATNNIAHQSHQSVKYHPNQTIPYIEEALGSYNWIISTNKPEAQNFFKQGIQLRWAYNVTESAISMMEARRVDPNCAMCYWGEAFALGSFLNGHMTEENSVYAREAILKASELSAISNNELEKDLINASIIRYPQDYQFENRRASDLLFAQEMKELYEKYPGNHDIATIYAVALFILEERRATRSLKDPNIIRLNNILSSVLNDDLTHPGACHLYIHLTESTMDPGLALPCASHLSDTIPIASHIQHMPSHTYNEVGMWGDSVKANIKAIHSDIKASRTEGFSYAASHNLHMLLYSASYDGQGAIALRAGKDYTKLTNNSMYEVSTLVRFGKFDEVMKNENRPDDDMGESLWLFSKGYSSLKLGNLSAAQMYAEEINHIVNTTEMFFRFDSVNALSSTLYNILIGEIFLSKGNIEESINAFEEAVSAEDSLDFNEPEALPFSARHWLGSALYNLNMFNRAEMVYKAELLDHPNNGWSLFGLKESLKSQNKEYQETEVKFNNSWSRSDTLITGSKF
ncbi:MAG: hypothetical protein CBC38_08085 [Gammaproteobacteria bacterium TMED78]|nr:MAG: hypothetical protein CBC38_08085 [Gammaproteobacteria bacterium TMED78]|tara:strand:- start:126 stop:1751 length:1626 start_codon:yes stop_codon:yes gene_type:complete